LDAWLEGIKAWRKETTACQEATEARTETDKEPREAEIKTHLEEVKARVASESGNRGQGEESGSP
jgi:hypothetical protein